MRRTAATLALPATIALLLAGCSGSEESTGSSPDDAAESSAFSDCPVAVDEVSAGDLGSEVQVISGVFYPTDESIQTFEYDEAQDVASPTSMIEVEQRFCAERVDEKVQTYSDDVSIELTPVQLENGETVYIEGDIGAPIDGAERDSVLGDARLTADEEYITDEVRAQAEELESGQGEAGEAQDKPAKMSVSSSSEQVARCTLYNGAGAPADDAQGEITVRYDGDERVMTIPDGTWDNDEPFSDGTTVEAKRVEVTVSTEPGVDITSKDLSCVYTGDDGTSVVEAAL